MAISRILRVKRVSSPQWALMGPIDAARVLVLFHGLHAGVDGRVARSAWVARKSTFSIEAADVLLQAPEPLAGATATDVRGRSDVCETRIVHSVNESCQ